MWGFCFWALLQWRPLGLRVIVASTVPCLQPCLPAVSLARPPQYLPAALRAGLTMPTVSAGPTAAAAQVSHCQSQAGRSQCASLLSCPTCASLAPLRPAMCASLISPATAVDAPQQHNCAPLAHVLPPSPPPLLHNCAPLGTCCCTPPLHHCIAVTLSWAETCRI